MEVKKSSGVKQALHGTESLQVPTLLTAVIKEKS